jgi:cell division protein FtsB
MSENSYQVRYEAMTAAALKLQDENKALKERNAFLTATAANLEKALEINKDIMRHTITTDNELKQAYIQEINDLKAEIKRLKRNGDLDRLEQ